MPWRYAAVVEALPGTGRTEEAAEILREGGNVFFRWRSRNLGKRIGKIKQGHWAATLGGARGR